MTRPTVILRVAKNLIKKNMSNKKSSNNFIVQGSILAIASIISRIVGMLYRIPLKGIIGKVGNDYYGTAFEIYSIILIISSYSLPLAVSKLVAARMELGQSKNTMKVLKGSLLFAFTSGTIFMCVVYFGADFFAGVLKTPMSAIPLRVLAPVILIVAVLGVFRGFFQGLHTMLPSAISQIIEQIVNAIISIVAAYYLFSYGAKIGGILGEENYGPAYGAAGGTLGTAMGAVAGLLFMLFIYLLYHRRFKKRVIRDHKKNVESYSEIMKVLILTIIPVLLSTTLYNISSILDQGIFKNIVFSQGYDAKTISEWWGVYTGEYKVLINVPISIASAIAASAVPTLTTAFRSGDMEKVQTQIKAATRFILIVAFPCMVGMAVLSGPIMLFMFSDSDPTSGNMLLAGSMAIVFYSLSTLSNGLLQGIDRLRIPVRNAAIALVLQLVFLVVALRSFDLNIYAVVYANAFYAFIMCLLNNLAVVKYSGAHQDFRSMYLLPGISSAVMGLAAFMVYKLLHLITKNAAISCIIAIVAGAFVYFVVMLLIRGITEEDLERFPGGSLLVRLAIKLRLL